MAKAFVFDMNGTIIDDMRYHTIAWQKMFNEDLNVPITWETMKENSYGTNFEVLERILGKGKVSQEELANIEKVKEQRYQETYAPHLALIDGYTEFIEKAKAKKIKLAIGTAAPTTNVDFTVDGLQIRDWFEVIVDADGVTKSKPDPEVFLNCAKGVGIAPEDCIVFEDSPKGVEAAKNAGMKAVVVLSYNDKSEFDHLDNILFYIHDYKDAQLNSLFD